MVSQNPLSHSPNLIHRYVEILDSVLGSYISKGNFVSEEDIKVDPFSSRNRPGFLLEGEIGCLGEIVIYVKKFLEITEEGPTPRNPWVETRWYNYYVFIRNHRNLFRYDNEDPDYMRNGHGDEHHKHEYDPKTGDELSNSPIWISADGWPLFHEVIEEAERWYWDHRKWIPNPEAFPKLGVRG